MSMRGRSRAARRPVDGPPAALWNITRALTDRKAVDLTVLDLRELSSATDYFVIASGTSEAHVRGMADRLLEGGPTGRPHHVEGLPQGRWVLLDYVDLVVHLFHPAQREFYQLERLWGDAPTLAVAEDGGPAPRMGDERTRG